MIRKSLPVIFLSVLMLHASEESPFSDFVVGIWPEYDHPGVLVIYTGTVKSDHLPLHFEALVPYEIDRALAVGQSQGAVVRYRLPTYEPLVVLAALSLIIGYMFWRSNHRRPKTAEKEFCPKCGAKVGKGDRYCSTCGKEVS